MGGGEGVGFEAKATIRRSEFGIATGIPLVSDEVKLDIIAAFGK
jgi:polyisoprenoid-binding protein YceI